jgi:hypothetical protein
MGLQEIGLDAWNGLFCLRIGTGGWPAFVKEIMNRRFPKNAVNFLTS